jgi:hypothetical protein
MNLAGGAVAQLYVGLAPATGLAAWAAAWTVVSPHQVGNTGFAG